ncbi:DNA-directed RNA polymerase III subunit RPC10, partial [Perkinsus olseni]
GPVVEDVLGGPDAWKDVQQTEAVCPADGCDSNRAYFKQMQIRSADEPMTTFYRCVNYPLELSAQEQARVDGSMCGSETYHKVVDSDAYAKAKEAAGYVWQKTCKGYDYLLTRSEEGLNLDRDGKSQFGRSWSVVSTATSVVVRNTPRYVKEAKHVVEEKCIKTAAEKEGEELVADEAEKVPVVKDVEKAYKVVGGGGDKDVKDVKPVGLIKEVETKSADAVKQTKQTAPAAAAADVVKEAKPAEVLKETKTAGMVRDASTVDPAKAHNTAGAPSPVLPGVGRKVADNRKAFSTSTGSKTASSASYKSSLRSH